MNTQPQPLPTPPAHILESITPLLAGRLTKVWPHYTSAEALTTAEIATRASLPADYVRDLFIRLRREGLDMPARLPAGRTTQKRGRARPLPAWALAATPAPAAPPTPKAMEILVHTTKAKVTVEGGAFYCTIGGQEAVDLIAKHFGGPLDLDAYQRTPGGAYVHPPRVVLVDLPADPTSGIPILAEEAEHYRVTNPWQLAHMRNVQAMAEPGEVRYLVPTKTPDGVRYVEDTPDVVPSWA